MRVSNKGNPKKGRIEKTTTEKQARAVRNLEEQEEQGIYERSEMTSKKGRNKRKGEQGRSWEALGE